MKIFAFSGSNKSIKSNTKDILEDIIKNIKDINKEEDIEVSIYTPSDIKICAGCTSCFSTGKCILDKKDNISAIIRKMKECDVIILTSPVYFHNVSGGMKNFIDRLSYLSYVFPCKGKIAVSISTSNTNGNEFVDNYLEKFLQVLGATVVKKLSLKLALLRQEQIDKEIKETATIIDYMYKNKSLIKATNYQEQYFKNYKNIFEKIDENLNLYYLNIWKEENYFKYNSFDELIHN
ncbi:NAD(P)H-dependent oxidoreductase [uncultured Clostridium sp.]|uniref:flavodoxin family protein n=1 Tax=uncultured Clostridium sp. TaxID=59620 RepID=UPI0025DDB1FB|nr:NAD(P)H-dependent oxidoreductase [uncultured Clostridium sp.]